MNGLLYDACLLDFFSSPVLGLWPRVTLISTFRRETKSQHEAPSKPKRGSVKPLSQGMIIDVDLHKVQL